MHSWLCGCREGEAGDDAFLICKGQITLLEEQLLLLTLNEGALFGQDGVVEDIKAAGSSRSSGASLPSHHSHHYCHTAVNTTDVYVDLFSIDKATLTSVAMHFEDSGVTEYLVGVEETRKEHYQAHLQAKHASGARARIDTTMGLSSLACCSCVVLRCALYRSETWASLGRLVKAD